MVNSILKMQKYIIYNKLIPDMYIINVRVSYKRHQSIVFQITHTHTHSNRLDQTT